MLKWFLQTPYECITFTFSQTSVILYYILKLVYSNSGLDVCYSVDSGKDWLYALSPSSFVIYLSWFGRI
jgi:hypothetical protein